MKTESKTNREVVELSKRAIPVAVLERHTETIVEVWNHFTGGYNSPLSKATVAASAIGAAVTGFASASYFSGNPISTSSMLMTLLLTVGIPLVVHGFSVAGYLKKVKSDLAQADDENFTSQTHLGKIIYFFDPTLFFRSKKVFSFVNYAKEKDEYALRTIYMSAWNIRQESAFYLGDHAVFFEAYAELYQNIHGGTITYEEFIRPDITLQELK